MCIPCAVTEYAVANLSFCLSCAQTWKTLCICTYFSLCVRVNLPNSPFVEAVAILVYFQLQSSHCYCVFTTCTYGNRYIVQIERKTYKEQYMMKLNFKVAFRNFTMVFNHQTCTCRACTMLVRMAGSIH